MVNRKYELVEYISEDAIKKRVSELAFAVEEHYRGKELLVLGILKGSVVFLSDLIRCIKYSTEISFMAVSSYGSSTVSGGSIRLLYDLDRPIFGKDILIVEDIVDTGKTLKYLIGILSARGANSIQVCALLDKPQRREVDLQADYVGFEIDDEFVVGYGMDYDSMHRNGPNISIVRFTD